MIRILLDHNTPAPLRHALVGHQVETAWECGWAELTNGELLRIAEEAGFDVMITTDQSIRDQQNLSGRKLALVVLSTNDCTQIREFKSEVTRRSLKFSWDPWWKSKSRVAKPTLSTG